MRGTSLALASVVVLQACGGNRVAREPLDAGEDATTIVDAAADQGEPDADADDADSDADEAGELDAAAPDAADGGEPDRDAGDAQPPDADARVDPARDLRLNGGFAR